MENDTKIAVLVRVFDRKIPKCKGFMGGSDRPGTKFSRGRGRGRDQVESAGAGINRDFEMLPRPGPGPGLAKICRGRGRGRGRDFLIKFSKVSGNSYQCDLASSITLIYA